ncbi:MAG: flagellar basal body-associated FliL family protein [Phycisphaerae bacterium]|nr:flagellar basal body-associated FliL family protein [Phycisphaerae bacterium]
MADVDDTKEQNESTAEKGDKKSFIGRFLPWIIIAAVVMFCAGAGFGLGRLFAGSGAPEAAEAGQKPDESNQVEDLTADNDSTNDSEKVWYYELDPVIANLNEPGVSRYVRASFTLEISAETDQKKGAAFLDEKKPILTDMLFVYLSGLSLKDIQGDKNLKSIQSRVRELFNERFFPDSKPQIKRVLIKEFPVQ